LEEYTNTDGSLSNTTLQIASAKRDELDVLQELAITNNLRCNKTDNEKRGYVSINTTRNTVSYGAKSKSMSYLLR
jgi:hypothetical protein